MVNHVFVYGTLRKGHRANSILEQRCIYKSTERLEEASIYHLGGFPGLKLGSPNSYVVGDIYELHPKDTETLERLDFYEGYSEGDPSNSLYIRRKVQVQGIDCWVYEFNRSTERYAKIDSGDWNAH